MVGGLFDLFVLVLLTVVLAFRCWRGEDGGCELGDRGAQAG